MTKEKQLVEFFRKAIKDSGKTATELHKETGITYVGIKKIMSGATESMQTKTVASLANALGIPIGEIERFYR